MLPAITWHKFEKIGFFFVVVVVLKCNNMGSFWLKFVWLKFVSAQVLVKIKLAFYSTFNIMSNFAFSSQFWEKKLVYFAEGKSHPPPLGRSITSLGCPITLTWSNLNL